VAEPDLVGIVVKEMGAALSFYRLLGLAIPQEADGESHVEYVTPGGFRIAWDTHELVESFDGPRPAPVGNRMGLAFLCTSPQEVDDLYAAVIDAGYTGHKAPWDAFWGQRYAVVVDPDGNLVDLFAHQVT
jgi:catechol 2,3-dioxygenase-like lactoylglutathione lyase family enzyme